MIQRKLARVVTLPAPSPGFLGAGHTAIEVLDAHALVENDPFVLLMDDRLDLGPTVRKIGEAHPHAGLETVTLFLEGNVADRDEGDTTPGDAQWMTAGRGVIHSENIHAAGRQRILQLWIRLPKEKRSMAPVVQLIKKASLPIRREPGIEARLYSGTSGSLTSPTKNQAAITLVDFHLEPIVRVEQSLPVSYNGFFYVLEGTVLIGAERTPVRQGQVGWIDRPTGSGDSSIQLATTDSSARVVMYMGQPQNEPLMHHGPFLAGSREDLVQVFGAYQAGQFQRLSQLSPQ